MRLAARAGAALAATAFVALGTPLAGAAPGDLVLPKPLGEIPVPTEVFADKPERLRRSIVPGGVDDTERLDVGLGPDGSPAAVSLTQRLVLKGTGQFVIWQRSSAQDVEALEDTTAPVLKREAVIWQGFVDGTKTLAARLTLDPALERELLPIAVELEWRGAGAIGPGGTLPGEGDIVVRLRNTTARGVDLPSGTADPAAIAGPLDRLLAAGTSRAPAVPPAAGRGLPERVRADLGPSRNVAVPAPMRVTGTIRVPGGTASSELTPATTPLPDGLQVDGVLQGDVEFVLRSSSTSTLLLDLRAFPTVDPRPLNPPNAPTWKAWAARRPSAQSVREATDALVRAAAEAARGHEYAPYLGHHGPGTVTTTFHLAMAPSSAVAAPEEALRPKPLPIALTGVGVLAMVASGAAIWRRL